MAPGQNSFLYPWPYIEGVTMAEAANDLAFMVTGAYDKPVAKQHGAPLRVALPWKYGFKSIKSIRKIDFVEERPVGLWEAIQPSEYGFWANVNPDVPHPRWSQASERVLHTGERVPTLIFNGYAEQVAASTPAWTTSRSSCDGFGFPAARFAGTPVLLPTDCADSNDEPRPGSTFRSKLIARCGKENGGLPAVPKTKKPDLRDPAEFDWKCL